MILVFTWVKQRWFLNQWARKIAVEYLPNQILVHEMHFSRMILCHKSATVNAMV